MSFDRRREGKIEKDLAMVMPGVVLFVLLTGLSEILKQPIGELFPVFLSVALGIGGISLLSSRFGESGLVGLYAYAIAFGTVGIFQIDYFNASSILVIVGAAIAGVIFFAYVEYREDVQNVHLTGFALGLLSTWVAIYLL